MLCKIGAVEVWRILDIHGPFLTPQDLFPNAGPDVSAIIEDRAPGSIDASSGRLILPVQGFLLKTPAHNILVDSCVGNDKTNPGFPDWDSRSDGRFMAAMTAAGVSPADIDYVLCTHLHVDHVGWNTQLTDGRWVPTFPNARYLMPASDEQAQRLRQNHHYTESILPVIAAGQAELVAGEHALGDHVTLVPTPGHTPGHVSVRVQSQGAEALITGDALHTTAQCWHPEWQFKFDADAEQAVTSRKSLLAQCAENNSVVLGNHFALPSIGRVAATAKGFAWKD